MATIWRPDILPSGLTNRYYSVRKKEKTEAEIQQEDIIMEICSVLSLFYTILFFLIFLYSIRVEIIVPDEKLKFLQK